LLLLPRKDERKFLNHNTYEAFIEESLDSTLIPDAVEEDEAMPIHKLGQGKVICIKAEDFQNEFYLLSLTVKIGIIRKPNQYHYHYLRVLEKVSRLRDIILIYPIERLVMSDPKFCRITWYDLVYDAKRTMNVPNTDLIDFSHLIQSLPLNMEINSDDPSVFPLFPEVEEKNHMDEES
jgi:hypothetical protein